MDDVLQPDRSFDMVKRVLTIGGRRAVLYFIDGFIKDEVFEKILEFLFKITPKELDAIKSMREFSLTSMPYVEVGWHEDFENTQTALLSGEAILFIDGIGEALSVDTRIYPIRGIKEPEKDKSLRGSRDGFVETLIHNTAMIRRRIRDPRLRMEYYQIGSGSKVDVAISFLEGEADEKLLNKIRTHLQNIKLAGISMTQQALGEVLFKTSAFNPYPRIKYTERPDYASACILDGKVVLAMDNTPTVMIFPVSFFDFFKEADDYYFPPFTGSYTRMLRMIVTVMTVFITPVYLYLANNQEILPPSLKFVITQGEANIPLYLQFLMLELLIDGLRLASINTPSSLSNSLGIVGGLLLSEFAIDAGWFLTDEILFMAFVAIASFAQPSYEMGYALKFERMALLLTTQFFDLWGLIGGAVLFILIRVFSKTLSGRGYMYPMIPFNGKDFVRLFLRTKIKNEE